MEIAKILIKGRVNNIFFLARILSPEMNQYDSSFMNAWEGEKAKTFMNKNLSTKRVQKNDFRSNRVRKLNEDPRVIVGWVPKSIMFSNLWMNIVY